MMLLTVLGSSVFQTAAILGGVKRGSGEFVRTEKFGKTHSDPAPAKRSLLRRPGIALVEALLLLYFSGALILDFRLAAWGFLPLHIFLFLGFAFMVWDSLQVLISARMRA